MKRFLALLLIIVMVLGVVSGCAKTEEKPVDVVTENGDTEKEKEDEKVVEVAQELSTVYSGEITTLNYLVTTTTSEFSLAANMVDTLIDYDKYGVIQPALATDWKVSDDGLKWTFNLRQGVKWVTHDGEEYAETVAQDFVDSIKYILDPTNESKSANIVYSVIANAEDYYNGEIEDFEEVGVKALDTYTLEYTLKSPTPYFESMLAYVSFFPVNGDFLEESGRRFGTDHKNLLYNGAYIFDVYEPSTKRILVKNEKYWDADNIFITKINQKYNKEASTLAPELFARGEIDSADISSDIIDQWMGDPKKADMVRPARTSFYTYFYALNFDPQFAEEYEPANWKIAVNNKNFRKSLFHALDRKAAMLTAEPYNPEQKLSNTITPKSFVDLDGVDYTQLGSLKKHADEESFNEKLALEFRDKAMAELEGKATFPIIVYMPYNAGGSEWANRVQVIEQQMENLLGKDYIDIQIEPYPPTGFLSAVRRIGNYAFLEVNWGPDYADPETYTDPFPPGAGTYNFPEFVEGYTDANGEKTYTNLLNAAKAEVIDTAKRYELFAEAEAFLIEEAFLIPYALGGGGYAASRLNPFESQYSPFGVSSERYKGQRVMEKPMTTEEYLTQLEQWEVERAEALKNAK